MKRSQSMAGCGPTLLLIEGVSDHGRLWNNVLALQLQSFSTMGLPHIYCRVAKKVRKEGGR